MWQVRRLGLLASRSRLALRCYPNTGNTNITGPHGEAQGVGDYIRDKIGYLIEADESLFLVSDLIILYSMIGKTSVRPNKMNGAQIERARTGTTLYNKLVTVAVAFGSFVSQIE